MRFLTRGIIGTAPLFVLLAACTQQPEGSKLTSTLAPAQSPAERGKYLVTVGGCHDCHTPKKIVNGAPEADMDRLLSGNPSADKLPKVPKTLIGPEGYGTVASNNLTAWVGPWGVSFAMNLTPDKDTGLGSWTEEMFVKAIKTGKHQGAGRDILPPMPWNWYRNMTDEDLKAVFAYLQTLPPIKNAIPDPLPPDKVPR
jgi:mono/diheme cytochrome c family protein